MNKSTLFGVACLLAAAAMGNTTAAAAQKFDTDPKHQLPRPDSKPADMKKPVKVFILLGQNSLTTLSTQLKISKAKTSCSLIYANCRHTWIISSCARAPANDS